MGLLRLLLDLGRRCNSGRYGGRMNAGEAESGRGGEKRLLGLGLLERRCRM